MEECLFKKTSARDILPITFELVGIPLSKINQLSIGGSLLGKRIYILIIMYRAPSPTFVKVNSTAYLGLKELLDTFLVVGIGVGVIKVIVSHYGNLDLFKKSPESFFNFSKKFSSYKKLF